MKQKLFALDGYFHVRDENGRDRFLVNAKFFTVGNKLSFQDLAGNELCFIKQIPFSSLPEYELYKGGQLWAKVDKELTFVRACFDVAEFGEGAADLQIEGDFMAHQYKVTRGLQHVADVSMKYFKIADTYSVDIVHGEDDVLILALTVVIDMVSFHRGGLSGSFKF
jgi:uncharacterized protein YxjI